MIYTLNRYICSYKHILCIKNKKKTKQILVYKKIIVKRYWKLSHKANKWENKFYDKKNK